MRRNAGPFLATLASIGAVATIALSAWGPVIAQTPLPPTKRTGAPGEGICSCHSGSGGDGQVEILGLPAMYMPGDTYTITIRLQDPGQSRWGFEVTVLKDSDDSMAGSLATAGSTTGYQEQSGRQYISHNSEGGDGSVDGTFAGTPNGPVSWPFDWTAPLAGSGTVTFFVGAVAANNDQSSGFTDYHYENSASVPEETPTDVDEVTWGVIKERFR